VPPPDLRRGQAVRGKGSPAQPVLAQLAAFLGEHSDQQVVVEWRVQE
jgi:hypothetical protein